VFVARPPAGRSPCRDLYLTRAVRRSFTGPAEFLADPAHRARVGEYLADMTRPFGCELSAELFRDPLSPALGQSYGEMAGALIGPAVPAGEPVDLLILAFSVHDLRPGRQTAAYLSHLTPGAPMAFAICDQGAAAAFSGVRIARDYASSAGVRRALLLVVEQAALPYDCPAAMPAEHRAVAMLYGATPGGDGTAAQARVVGVRQHPGVRPADVAALAAADLAELTAGRREVRLVLGDALAGEWSAPGSARVRMVPPGQPCTGTWWGLIDELGAGPARPDLLLVADYDPCLGYLCWTSFDTGPRPG